MSNERRHEDRVIVNRDFESIEEFITEYVSNISRSGVFVRSDDPLPVGTRVDLRFSVIVDDFETIEGVGEVTRIVPVGAPIPSGMGVVFVELTTASRAVIDALLTRKR